MAFPNDLPPTADLPFGPTRFEIDADGMPSAPDFGDIYHGRAGAWAQAQHVFLAGNALPQRWGSRERFVILETGFGLGNNFLATWAAWRADPRRCERLVFLSIEKHPLNAANLGRALAAGRDAALTLHDELAAALLAQWPAPTPGQHVLSFDEDRVQLHLLFGDVQAMLRGLDSDIDAFYLDGFAPARNPAMWAPDVFRRIARLAAPGATAATWSSARQARDGLVQGGFRVEKTSGIGGKRDITRAVYAPVHHPARAGSTPRADARYARAGGNVTPRREALVIGAGLAGCAAAWALARQGWQATVLDRHAAPAQETSGNPGGLMHGIFNAPDSLHARWFRAAALHTHRVTRAAVEEGHIAGQLDGFLRVETRRQDIEACAQLAQVGLPRSWLDWAGHEAITTLTGLDLRGTGVQGAWHFGNGGWLSPADLCRWWFAQAEAMAGARWQGSTVVAALRRGPDARRAWQALDAQGHLVAEAPVIVLANAHAAPDLLAGLGDGVPALPLSRVRGQTSVLPAQLTGLTAPLRPLSGQGYALTLPDGRVLCGATSQPDDPEPGQRDVDHRHNLARAAALGVVPADLVDLLPGELGVTGRTGWRALTADRLPVVGPPVDRAALAEARAAGRRLDQVRHLPRCHGLAPGLGDGPPQRHGVYVFTGLGSRGITSAALAAELLASWVTGAPCPVPVELRDALDIARFGA